MVTVLFQILATNSFGQECDCPSVTECGACSGGISSFTLQYNGMTTEFITVNDQLATVFSGTVSPGEYFLFNSTNPSEKFSGPVVRVYIAGNLNTEISSLCNQVNVGETYGSFTIRKAKSKSGGQLCCPVAYIETTPPVFSGCPSGIEVNLSASACVAVVNWVEPIATDNCGNVVITSTHNPGAEFSFGITPVTYTATDQYGNLSTCSFNVVVKDVTPPSIGQCPAEVRVAVQQTTCEASVTWTPPVVTDNCSAQITSDYQPGDTFPIGETVVTYTASDPTGNMAKCSFTVYVNNANAPAVSGCPENITAVADETLLAVVNWEEPMFTISCGELIITQSHQPGNAFSIGTTQVIYMAESEDGKKTTCSFLVTVMPRPVAISIGKAVTPDGDGINDWWHIGSIEDYPKNRVTVFDRWGGIVFKASGYDNERVVWHGTNMSGTLVPTGTYFYVLEITDQQTVTLTGSIEIVR